MPRSMEGLTDADVQKLLIIEENNAEIIKNALNDGVVQALEEIGLAAERYAFALCPVDTGRLHNSITHQLDVSDGEKCVYVGTDVEYAIYVEFGTTKHKAQKFLRPAATDHVDEYRKILQSKLGK